MFNSQKFKTLMLKNGDISFDNLGKLNWLTNEESIAQTVNIRLMTEIGDLFYDEQFGMEKRHIKNTTLNIATLEPEIRAALIDDEKIIDAKLIDIIVYNNNETDEEGNFLNGTALLKVAVTLHDQSEILLDLNMGGE